MSGKFREISAPPCGAAGKIFSKFRETLANPKTCAPGSGVGDLDLQGCRWSTYYVVGSTNLKPFLGFLWS